MNSNTVWTGRKFGRQDGSSLRVPSQLFKALGEFGRSQLEICVRCDGTSDY
jgi:hypothetical protein